ncbi:MAG: DUF4337 domain-containing protein [Chlorobium sp.]|nr:MAG: DUF4337 domain-containing protein [Chlorobium sp.]
MSEEFEVKGPHDEILEGEEKSNAFNSRIAIFTSIMATLGALLSYEASASLGEAIILKNDATIKKTEAADQWNYYQSKNNRQNIAELATMLTTGKNQEISKNNATRYGNEKEEIRKKAEAEEKLSENSEKRSERLMHEHHLWATGATTLQIAISLAAMSLLTRRKWLLNISLACAGCGVGFGIFAFFGL